MKCLETRKRNGMRWRRYLTEDGRIVTTYELPTAVLSLISKKALADQLAAFERGEARRARAQRMHQLIAEGVKPTAIAHELGVTEQAVRNARKKINSESKKGTP